MFKHHTAQQTLSLTLVPQNYIKYHRTYCRAKHTVSKSSVSLFPHLESDPKWALCSFGDEIQAQNSNIYNITEVVIQTHKYIFFPVTE